MSNIDKIKNIIVDVSKRSEFSNLFDLFNEYPEINKDTVQVYINEMIRKSKRKYIEVI